MSTMGALVDRILANCGKADSGENRDLVLADLKDLLRVDLPHAGGASFAQGIVSLSLGVTGSVREDGVYPFPRTLRSFESALQFVDAAAMPNPTFTPTTPDLIHSDPDVFYQIYKSGNAQVDADYGKPVSVLIYGRSIHVRPIPKQTAVAAPWWGTLLLSGTVYVDVDSIVDGSDCPVFDYEPALVAKGTLLEAARRSRDDLIQLWAPIAQARADALGSISVTTARRVQPSKDF